MKYQPLNQPKRNMTWIWVAVAVLLILGVILLISALSTSNQPDVSQQQVDAIYTNVALTLAAGGGPPTATQPPPTPFILETATATLEPLPLPPSATLSISTPQPAANCYNSVYVSDVTVPDGTVMTPGQKFTKTWKVSNNGTCAWTATFKLSYVSGEQMDGKPTAINLVVEPGRIADISVELTAPMDKTGELTGKWALVNDQGIMFGNHFTVVIVVGAASTPTETPTP